MLIKMEVGEIGENEAMASYDFGNVNCEQPVKLNIKKSLMQFSTDPLFNKRLQAFDSDSLKSLFLNVFEVIFYSLRLGIVYKWFSSTKKSIHKLSLLLKSKMFHCRCSRQFQMSSQRKLIKRFSKCPI